MKTLYDKIMSIYPQLSELDFRESIILRNDGDEKGDYIVTWNHPTIPRVTDEQLSLIEEKTE